MVTDILGNTAFGGNVGIGTGGGNISFNGSALVIGTQNALPIQFRTSGNTAVVVDTLGNVGIATTVPVSLLTVGSSTVNPSARMVFGKAQTATEGNLPAIGQQSTTGTGNDLALAATSTSGNIRLFTGVSVNSGEIGTGSNTERMRVDNAGYVGIGTTLTAGNSRLNVDLGITARTTPSSGTSPYLQLLNGNASTDLKTWRIGGGSTGTLTIETINDAYSSANTRMSIDNLGNVYINTSSQYYRATRLTVLQTTTVNGAAAGLATGYTGDVGVPAVVIGKFDNNNTTSQIFVYFLISNTGLGAGQINANGAGQAAFGSFSDARLKENIADLPPQLGNICALRPVEFDYKDGSGHQIGFIAQEMQAVYPDAVGTREDGMLTISGWSKNEARLVAAIQELKAELDAVKAELAAIKGAGTNG
jgi:hypothetical protein